MKNFKKANLSVEEMQTIKGGGIFGGRREVEYYDVDGDGRKDKVITKYDSAGNKRKSRIIYG